MPIDRPTFSESWYRVAALRPRLRASLQTSRQHYRGRRWHVVQDPSNNQFFRLNDASYHFVGLLDGRRTVAQAWEQCNDALGDEAPTQGEAIELLGQLYSSNLIQSELPADAQGMFERHRKRVRREVTGYLTNFLFIRIPLFDPDPLLERWRPAVGWLFGPAGLVLWLSLLAIGAYHLVGRGGELLGGMRTILDWDNLLLLYLCFAGVKALHELGHGFACKRFGVANGSGGEVHTVGIMFLVFMPVPYVDASSSWAFPSKRQRAFVGVAGVYVELAIAAIAAIVWARTGATTTTHALAYNVIIIASVSTLLFNGNPLLRFDGYYVLSDLLEIPNLSRRGRDYAYYLVKRYLYRVHRPKSPAHSRRERVWLGGYYVASTVYRIFICIAILWFIAGFFFFVGVVLGLAAVVTWVIVPMGKFTKYLATSPELARVRTWSVSVSCLVIAAVLGAVMLVPVPDRARVHGVVEPLVFAVVHAGEDGFVDQTLAPGTSVVAGRDTLFSSTSPELEAERDALVAQRRQTEIHRRQMAQDQVAVAEVFAEQRDTLDARIARIERRRAALVRTAPASGIWIPDDEHRLEGAFLHRGQATGVVASLDAVIVRAVADQRFGPRIMPEIGLEGAVDIRVNRRPDTRFPGTVRQVLPAGQDQLPSAALGYVAGGPMAVHHADATGTQTAEAFFEVRIEPHVPAGVRLQSGQRVVVRFTSEPKPIGVQLWRTLQQMIQQRFEM